MVQADGEGEEGMNEPLKFYGVFDRIKSCIPSILQVGMLRKSEERNSCWDIQLILLMKKSCTTWDV